MIEGFLWTAIAFFSGAIPFSVLIGWYVLGQDIRTVGDGNPGATNVLRAGAPLPWFIAAFMLDFFKGIIPVGIAYFFAGINDTWIIPVAIAPVAGHAFSPFLGFRGGKAVATTFGIWGALTLGEMPIILGIFLVLMFLTLDSSSWAVILTMIGGLLHLLLNHPDELLLGVWLGNMLILIYKHRADLGSMPGINSFALRLTGHTPA